VNRIETTRQAQRDLEKIQGRDFDRVVAAIRNLKENPRPPGCKKLKRTIFRIRVGNWRVIYAVFDKDKRVIIGKVERRSEDTYDKVEDLF